jgi:hypothetical protein
VPHYVSALELEPEKVVSVALAGKKMGTYHEVDLSRKQLICTRRLRGVMSGVLVRDNSGCFGLTSLGKIMKWPEFRLKHVQTLDSEIHPLLIDYCVTNELVLAALVDYSGGRVAADARRGVILVRDSRSGNLTHEESVDGLLSLCILGSSGQDTLVVLTDRRLQAWNLSHKKLTLLSSLRWGVETEGTVSAMDDRVLLMTREGALSSFEIR